MTYDAQMAKSRERFERETAEHQMTVLRDDGLYRHLRCQKPGTYSYGFDIMTWPGRLAIDGDCGSFMFSRIEDMFEFFESMRGEINPQYWAEKLRGPGHDMARRYSYDEYRQQIDQWVADQIEWADLDASQARALRKAVQEQLLDDLWGQPDEHEAHSRLRDFEHNGRTIGDSWEWDLREYDWQYLWCCRAIVWAIGQYRKATEAVAA